jgi:hypothetical protein
MIDRLESREFDNAFSKRMRCFAETINAAVEGFVRDIGLKTAKPDWPLWAETVDRHRRTKWVETRGRFAKRRLWASIATTAASAVIIDALASDLRRP